MYFTSKYKILTVKINKWYNSLKMKYAFKEHVKKTFYWFIIDKVALMVQINSKLKRKIQENVLSNISGKHTKEQADTIRGSQ